MLDAWSFVQTPTPGSVRFNFAAGTPEGTDTAGHLLLAGTSRGTWTSPVHPTPFGRAALEAVVRWDVPQTWEKHAANPVYDVKRAGAWTTWVNGVSILPLSDGKRYRMFFAGQKGQGVGIAHASIDDPTSWTSHEGNPIFKARDNWEGGIANQPRVVKITQTHWRMYYTGWGWAHQGGSPWAMGVADSFDEGLTWERVMDEPFMLREPSPGYDDGGACVPMVIRHGAGWLMWYTAGKISSKGLQHIHICLARSSDGLSWEKFPGNPVLSDNFADDSPRTVISRCFVALRGGVFRMWYSFGKPMYRIHYAESLDGIHWENIGDEPMINVGPKGAWDDNIIEYPELQIPGGGQPWRLFHCGNGYGNVGLATGVPSCGADWEFRTGASKDVDAGWSAWRPVKPGEDLTTAAHAQVRATLWRDASARRGPVVNWAALAPR